MRHVALDTEVTGLDPALGNRIIEIAGVELLDGQRTGVIYHQYINPLRASEEPALAVHGLTEEFLQDKPTFQDIAAEFLAFIEGAELIMHHAAFDINFYNNELKLTMPGEQLMDERFSIIDTLVLVKKIYPGCKYSLDALVERFGISVPGKELPVTLQDAMIVAEIYSHLKDRTYHGYKSGMV